MRSTPLLAMILALLGCDPDPGSPFPTTPNGGGSEGDDADGDGYDADEDCDDNDPEIAPNQPERCDGVDNNCDGAIDEDGADGARTWFADLDGDGFGDEATLLVACEGPPQYIVGVVGDCDDEDPDIHPGVDEVCNKADDDCDGETDEALNAQRQLGSVHAGLREVFGVSIDANQSWSLTAIEDRLTPYRFTSLATDDDGLVYAYDEVERHLYVLNTCTGYGTGVGPVDAGWICGMAFGPDGHLYAFDADNDQLVILSTEDGSAEVVGPVGFDIEDCGLAYSCEYDTLYGAELPGNTIFRFNGNTGLGQERWEVDVPFQQVGLEHNPDTNELIAGTGAQLYAITVEDYISRPLGGLVESDDLAWIPTCPN